MPSENAELLDVIGVLLTPDFFASDGELQTCTGYYRTEYEALDSRIRSAEQRIELRGDDQLMMVAAINNIAGYPHGLDELCRDRLRLGPDRASWYGTLFARLIDHLPGYKD